MDYVSQAESLSTEEIVSLLKFREEFEEKYQRLDQRLSEVLPRYEDLQKQVAFFKKELFGKKSEKRLPVELSANQLYLGEQLKEAPEDKEPATEEITYTRSKRKKGKLPGNVNESGGLAFTDDVPKVTVKLKNPELEGLKEDEYEVIKTLKSYTLAQQPIMYTVIEYVQEVVKRKDTGAISTSPKFSSPLEGSYADVSLLANILVDKFQYHLPLYRQHQRIQASGIKINRANLTNYVHRSLSLLKPIYDAQLESIRQGEIAWMDETPFKAGVNKKKKQMKSGYLWSVYGSNDEVLFYYSPLRSQKVIKELLGEDFKGVLQTDDHSAYSSYVSKLNEIEHALCWAHLRRKFIEAEKFEPALVEKALEYIRELYAVEKEARGLEPEKVLKIRGEKAKLIVDTFFEWLRFVFTDNSLLPSNPFTEAANYALSNEKALRVFLDNPAVTLDTNHIEREIRPVVVGRKNSYDLCQEFWIH